MRSQVWTFSPLWVPALIGILLVELGSRRLIQRSSESARQKGWRRRAWLFDFVVVAVCLIDSSPLMGVAMSHLTAHMLLHIVEMFYLPLLLVLAGPFLPVLFAAPLGERRAFLRWFQLGRLRWLTRGVARFVTAPIVGFLAFNGTMLFWHLPVIFNWASRRPWVDTWLMLPSFLIAGYLFWRLVVGSGPYGPRASTRFQIFAVMATAFEMLFLAIAMSVMSHSAWYQMNIEMLGPQAALQDQQTAAGVLWVCGDFWVIPAMVVIARRIISDSGGVSDAFERALGRS